MKKAAAALLQPANTTPATKGKTDAASLLKADHRKVEKIFAQFEETEDEDQKRKLVQQVCLELIIHTRLEEEIFYPACHEKDVEDDMLDEAQVEHDGAKVLIADLLKASPGDDFYDAKVKTLSEYIKHHVAEEEKPRSGIFAKAQKAGVDMAGLGQKLQARKMELMAESEAMTSNPPSPRSIQLQPQKETTMARNSNDRDRDERGRFTDDDNGGGNRGGYQSRGQDRERDDQGRFASDEDDRGGRGGYQSRGGRDDDDRGTRGGRGQGGWFGDSEGHSQASREGWEDRGSSRSSRGYDDDRSGSSRGGGQGRGWFGDSEGHSQASREGWDDRGSSRSSRGGNDDDDRGGRGGSRGSQGGRGQGGWFGDSEGHSQASREGWRNSSHEGSGWFGDSEGHSRASREGWEDRSGSRYSGQQSRGRNDDDDRGSRGGGNRGGQGHGGWFGDSEGHSQAAREGWRNR